MLSQFNVHRGVTQEVGDHPPSEFRIFRKGWNESTKGPVLFDADACASVMSAWRRHGADIMIDLEHLSLAPESRAFDPDARGWCQLELRSGELWAVNVRWTPDGVERLNNKKQRYISPAFYTNESLRVVEILNIALCAMPATNQLTPLVAAKRLQGANMNDEQMKKLRQLFELGDDASIQDMIAALSAMSAEQVLGAILAAIDKSGAGEKKEEDPDAEEESPEEDEAEGGEESEMSDDEAPADDEEEDDSEEEFARVIKEELGVTGADELRAALKAMKMSADSSKRLRELEVRELISANRAKIPPKLEAWALSQTKEALEAFLRHAPDVVVTSDVEPPDARMNKNNDGLTEADLEVCRITNTDPKKLAEHKQRISAA